MLEEAQLIVFLYDFANLKTHDRIQTDYLNTIHKHSKNSYDLVIVGNKIDLLDQNTQYNIIDQDKNLLKESFKDLKINFIYEFISCKKNFNINHLFFTIISCVVYPYKPLLAVNTKTSSTTTDSDNSNNDHGLERIGVPCFQENFDQFSLSPFQFLNNNARKALTRVFRVLNLSSCETFGVISQSEFMRFHKDVFGKALDEQNLESIADFLNDNVKLYFDSYYEKLSE